VSVLEKKVKDAVKGQGSRDALIESLQGKIQELQQQIDECKVITDSLSFVRSFHQGWLGCWQSIRHASSHHQR